MKKISTRVLIYMLSLLIVVLGGIGFWTFNLLKSESRAYTFQTQLLQTQVVSIPFNELTKKINLDLDLILENQKVSNPKAVENVDYGLKPNSSATVQSIEVGTQISVDPENQNQLVFRKKNAISEAWYKAKIDELLQSCQGLPVDAINENGEMLFSCDQKGGQSVKAKYESATRRILASKFAFGSFEEQGVFWSFSQPNRWLRVIGRTSVETALRPAYYIGLRLVLLFVGALGFAVLLSIGASRKITNPILNVIDATERIANGDFGQPIENRSLDETKVLSDSVNRMATKIRQLIVSEVEKTKLESQLEVAGAVQRTLIPSSSLSLEAYQVESLYLPADQCGGDWWGYLESPDHLIVLIGDVTGHGYPSALLVATTRGMISLLQAQIDSEQRTPWSSSDI